MIASWYGKTFRIAWPFVGVTQPPLVVSLPKCQRCDSLMYLWMLSFTTCWTNSWITFDFYRRRDTYVTLLLYCISSLFLKTLLWRHNEPDGLSNHQPHDCLLNRLFGHRSKKHQSSASLAFVREIHRRPVNSPHKWPVTRKMFPFDYVIMIY